MSKLEPITTEQIRDTCEKLNLPFDGILKIAKGGVSLLTRGQCIAIEDNEDELEGLLPWIIFPCFANDSERMGCFFKGPGEENQAIIE